MQFAMKKLFLIVVLPIIGFAASAQQSVYTSTFNIPYYNVDVIKKDSYVRDRCMLDIYYPQNSKGFSTVIWFHGGGLTGGNKEIPEALKEKNICVVGVGYRLSPIVKVKECIEDAAAAVAWVFNHINEYGGDSTLIFVSGHSAGGYLALMVGLDKEWLKPYNIDANRIAGLIPLSGQAITHFTIRKERGIAETQPVIDEFAPLYYVRADAPPLLLITGDRELELLGRYEENAYLARMMKIVGHKNTRLLELQGYGHMMTEPAFPLLLNEVQRISTQKKELTKTRK